MAENGFTIEIEMELLADLLEQARDFADEQRRIINHRKVPAVGEHRNVACAHGLFIQILFTQRVALGAEDHRRRRFQNAERADAPLLCNSTSGLPAPSS